MGGPTTQTSIRTPIRALHVFGLLSRTGGAEKWMLDILHCQQARQDHHLQIDFLLNVDDGPLVEEARSMGSDVHLIPFSRSPLPWSWGNSYLKSFRQLLRSRQYDVVHTHQFDLSGELLRIAAEEGVPVRTMSVHATEYENPRFYRRLVHRVWGHPWILLYATSILPCSHAVEESFFSSGPLEKEKTKILYTGIETGIFRDALKNRLAAGNDSFAFSTEYSQQKFKIPEDAVVIGHIGRFTRQKNHAFLIDLLEEMIWKNPNLYAVLVGQGELLGAMRKRVQDKDLAQRILLPGPRSDVPDLLISLFDVFVLPSLYEGLPIVAFEALACGLSVVMSDRVSHELNNCFPDRIIQVPLEADTNRWIEEIKKMLFIRMRPAVALKKWEKTEFTIQASLNRLISIYEDDLKKSGLATSEKQLPKND